MKKLKTYTAPETYGCIMECQNLVAESPTSEDYCDPVEYGGF